jgi:hypothetical protein
MVYDARMGSHRKRRGALLPPRLPGDVYPSWRPAWRHAHGGARLVALAAAAVLLTGVAAAWMLVPSPGAGRSRAMTMASATRPVAGPLMGVIKLANESGTARGQLPPGTCQPDSTTMVTCIAPAPGIAGVVLSTYPSLRALYAAYVARVKSLNDGRFRQNFQGCGLASSSAGGEVAWNRQSRHPRDFTVAQMAAGTVVDPQAAGRMFCTMLAGAQEDIVWTQDDGAMLGWVAGEPYKDVWDWWVDVHRDIVFSGYTPRAMPTPGDTAMAAASPGSASP